MLQTDRQTDGRTDRQTGRQTDEDGRPNPSDFKTHWRRRLSVQLQICNARVIARKMAIAASGRQSVQ